MRVAPGLTVSMWPLGGRTRSRRRSGCRGWSAGGCARPRAATTPRCTCSRASAELLGHVGEGARQAAELVARRRTPAWRVRSPRGHLAHAFGQQQQRPRQLVAQRRPPAAPRRTPPGPAPASACRCTSCAGRRAPARAAGTRGRRACTASALAASGARQRLRRPSGSGPRAPSAMSVLGHAAPARARARAAPRRRRLVVQALELARPRAGCAPGAAAPAPAARAQIGPALPPAVSSDLAAGAEQRRRPAPRAARAGAPAPAADGAPRVSPRRSAASAGLGRRGRSTSASSVPRPRSRPASSAPSTLHVEPGLDAARDELVAHGVDQHARHHADQREDAGQLEQQPAAELAAPHAQPQAHAGDARSPAPAAPATAMLTQNSQT